MTVTKEDRLGSIPPTKDILHVFRAISVTDSHTEGSYPASEVEDYIREYMVSGYKVAHIQHIRTISRENTPIAEQMMYILLRE